jgi:predicted nucleic acid-binding protein
LETLEASSVCLDTSVLIDNLRGKKQTVEFIRKLEDAGIPLSTTTINSFELYYGAYRSKRRDKNLAATRAILTRLVILDLTDESSNEAGRILALLEEKGDLIGFRDALVAAIAMTHKMTLATRDTEHFSRVPDLGILEAP